MNPLKNKKLIESITFNLPLALILGLITITGYFVVPVLFANAPTRHEAGMLAGHIFHKMNLALILLSLLVMLAFFRFKNQGKLRWTLLLILLAFVIANEFGLAPYMAALKAKMGPIDQVAGDNPDRLTFGALHGVSSVLHLIESICALWLFLIGKKE